MGGLWAVLRAGPKAWGQVMSAIRKADVGGLKRKLRLAGLAATGAQLAMIARKRGWSHLHVHSCGDSAHVAMFANLISGLPYSVTLHGPLEDYGPNQAMKWRHAKFGIVITQRLLKEVREQLNGSAPAEIDVAPMGVNVGTFRRHGEYVPWKGEGRFRIFSCGRLNVCKGHDDLIRAVGILRDGGMEVRLQIAGADDSLGKYLPVLQQLIDELKLNEEVKLLGAVPEQVVRDGLDGSHAFALASLREPLGVAIMEAMAMAMPVVATNAGGVPELVSDGADGLLVPPRNPAALAEGLKRIASDPELAMRLAAAAREKVERSFQSDQSARVLAARLKSTEAPHVPTH